MSETDILILIMGQTGVGKSTFINFAAGEEAVSVGHGLNSWTREPKHVICFHPEFALGSSRRIILVDTPGLNNEDREDSDILVHITDWMKVTCNNGMSFGGIIYLSEASQRYLPLFSKLRANVTIRDTVLSVGTKSEMPQGVHFRNSLESAWEIIGLVLQRQCVHDIAQIRTQLVQIARKPKKPRFSRILARFASLFRSF